MPWCFGLENWSAPIVAMVKRVPAFPSDARANPRYSIENWRCDGYLHTSDPLFSHDGGLNLSMAAVKTRIIVPFTTTKIKWLGKVWIIHTILQSRIYVCYVETCLKNKTLESMRNNYQKRDERGKPDDREAAYIRVCNHCSNNREEGDASIHKVVYFCSTYTLDVEFFDQIYDQVRHPTSRC